jgi:hypothetical protein
MLMHHLPLLYRLVLRSRRRSDVALIAFMLGILVMSAELTCFRGAHVANSETMDKLTSRNSGPGSIHVEWIGDALLILL